MTCRSINEMALVNDIRKFAYKVNVYGGEHRNPDFHFSALNGDFSFKFYIPYSGEWKNNKTLELITGTVKKGNGSIRVNNYNQYTKDVNGLIKWLDKLHHKEINITNLKYIQNMYNIKNYDNMNTQPIY
jgi:hypothetical protein